MPEGHTVARWARELRQLQAEPLLRVTAPARWRARADTLVGERLVRVTSAGKNLLLHFSNELVVRSHAMQYGSWQIGVPGMALRKEARFIRLRLTTAEHDAAYFHGPVMEILTLDEFAVHGTLVALGPDLLSAEFDSDEVLRRLQAEGERAVGDAIIDQRVVAGIGNIYKSEGLFLAGIDPQRPAAQINGEELRRLWDVLIPLMHAGSHEAGATSTLPEELRGPGRYHWAYRRRGHPCLRCGTSISMARQGELNRATYYCSNCQN